MKVYEVYEFPALEEYHYRIARYMTPRKSTGAMRRLYKIDTFLVFTPSNEQSRQAAMVQAQITIKQRTRLNAFLANETAAGRSPNKPMRYFITDGTSEFLGFSLHGVSGYFPTVDTNNQFRCYFRREELLSKRRHVELLPNKEYNHLGYYPLA